MGLPSTEPTEHELRMVVWKLTDIETFDEWAPNAQVSMKIQLDNGEEVKETTDVHSDTKDHQATFNWRMIFPVKIPCRETKLQIMVLNVGRISSNMIGAVTLDLGRDYAQGKRTGAEVVLPRGKLRLFHPDSPGKVRGLLDMQGILLHGIEAKSRVQGKGWEDPNDDPWVNPDDPHLLKGRQTTLQYMADTAAAAGKGLWFMAKYGMMIKIGMA